MAETGRVILWAERGLRVLVTAVFLWAGSVKAWDPAAFQSDIVSYRLVPVKSAFVLAGYLPWLELFAAMGLWIRRMRDGATLLLAGLTLVFLFALVAAWVRGLDVSCGCFGGSEKVPARLGWLVARDVGLLVAVAATGILGGRRAGRRSGEGLG